MDSPRREVVHGDAVAWLRAHPRAPGTSVLTSLPDVSELGVGFDAWRAWFLEAAQACLDASAEAGVCVFVQTDIKREGRWISKPEILFTAAAALGVPLVFHKIVCRRPPGSRSPGRPGYSHLLGFSRAALDDPSHPSPDVLPDRGELAWSHSVGTAPLAAGIERIQRLSPSTTTIVAPFCGIGVALALANAAGLDAIGIERNRKRAAQAEIFTLEPPSS